MLIVEMAAYYRTQGISMLQARENLYKKYGVFKHQLESFAFEGAAGMTKMAELMQNLRTNAPAEIGGMKVVEFADYKKGTAVNTETGASRNLNLPSADVLTFFLPNHASVVVRPSGTEPKIKVYYTTAGKTMDEATALSKQLQDSMHKLIAQ